MEVRNICKAFGSNTVLNNVSFSVPDGGRVLISAPSGRGKTTLLRIMMGTLKPDSGTVSGRPAKQACVFQEDRLQGDFSAVKCIKMTCPRTVTKEEICRHMAELGLGDHGNKPVSQLSGGMRRRVAIIRAVLSDADIIYFDEPFTGLDVQTKQRVVEYINRYASGKTMVFVSHDINDSALLNANKLCI